MESLRRLYHLTDLVGFQSKGNRFNLLFRLALTKRICDNGIITVFRRQFQEILILIQCHGTNLISFLVHRTFYILSILYSGTVTIGCPGTKKNMLDRNRSGFVVTDFLVDILNNLPINLTCQCILRIHIHQFFPGNTEKLSFFFTQAIKVFFCRSLSQCLLGFLQFQISVLR